ncbi:hypothetical protein GQ457_14G001770 [Hibiscus cannabinus]
MQPHYEAWDLPNVSQSLTVMNDQDLVTLPKDWPAEVGFNWTINRKIKDLERKDQHDHNTVERAEIGVFILDELRGISEGRILPIFFPVMDHFLYPPFLPKEHLRKSPTFCTCS